MNGVQGLEMTQTAVRERVGLAVLLTAVEVVVFFGFIVLAAFSPATLAMPLSDGSPLTLAFAYGMVILVVSVLLTGLYVLAENSNEVGS
jgi:uncharacterized membrane protein (DUF485 family)